MGFSRILEWIAMPFSRGGKQSSITQTRRGLTLLSQPCRDPAVGVRNGYIVKAMVFQVVMYGCENWTTKKAEHKRIVALKLWCW